MAGYLAVGMAVPVRGKPRAAPTVRRSLCAGTQMGSWAILDALKMAYQQPDDATMLRVVTHRTELREVR